MHIQQQTLTSVPQEEMIMVVSTKDLFNHQASWLGIKSDHVQDYIDRIIALHEFQPRSLMEQDPSFKQIIPYMIFTHNNKYFLMQRQDNASEARLKSKMTLGIGGHLRAEDIEGANFGAWARREFHEEIEFDGSYTISFLGLLNDDSNAVGQVHVGLLMLLTGSSDNIAIKSELKSGSMVNLDECLMHYESLESWSQIVYNFLAKQQIASDR
jgi:predicted NUDIX family phosphoesterase